MLPIGANEQKSCLNIIESAAEVCRFTREEFRLLDEIISWLQVPTDIFWFQFSIIYSNDKDSEEYVISNDSECFRIEDIRHEDFGYGGDTYTTYQYLIFRKDSQTKGNLHDFESSAMELIQSMDDQEMEIRVTLTKLE